MYIQRQLSSQLKELAPLYPHHENFSKRLIKSPKLYFYDTGLLCSLLGLESADQLVTHYLRGAIFENWVIAEIIKQHVNAGRRPDLYFSQVKYKHRVPTNGLMVI